MEKLSHLKILSMGVGFRFVESCTVYQMIKSNCSFTCMCIIHFSSFHILSVTQRNLKEGFNKGVLSCFKIITTCTMFQIFKKMK